MRACLRISVLLVVITVGIVTDARTAEAQGLAYGVGGFALHGGGVVNGGSGYQASGGGEFLVKGIAGGGAEVGFYGNTSSILSVTSFNGVVHLPRDGDSAVPFITGGYSRFSSGEGSFNTWNVGAGADFWFTEHAAFRLDVRDHIRPDSRGTVHYFAVRFGVAFK